MGRGVGWCVLEFPRLLIGEAACWAGESGDLFEFAIDREGELEGVKSFPKLFEVFEFFRIALAGSEQAV